jgi:hypothetical protein
LPGIAGAPGHTRAASGTKIAIEEFFTINWQNGLLALFTCGYGDFDCDGYYVNVSCTDATLILQNSYHLFNRSLQSAFEYHLDWQEVRGIAEEIFNYLQKIYERNPRDYVTTGYAGGNLLSRIPDYQKSFLLIH